MNKLFVIIALLITANSSFAQQNDRSDVEIVFGKKGNVQDNVFKLTFPDPI